MPITPLHFGLIPLINRVVRRRISASGFVLANVIADIPVIAQVVELKQHEMGGPPIVGTLHSVFSHNFAGALVLGVVLGALGYKFSKWWFGCLAGTLTHVCLDMIVHADMQPFAPWYPGNPFFVEGAYSALSVVLVVLLGVWCLDLLDARRKRRHMGDKV